MVVKMSTDSHFKPGLMASPIPQRAGPGLMAMAARPGRGFMTPHPDAPAFEWSHDGIAALWLVALILGLVVSVGLLDR
jgi:hypothetical protein